MTRLRTKGFRNGNWRKLNKIERALYTASLSLAKTRGRLVNSRLVQELRLIIEKLRETAGDRLMRSAYLRATELYTKYVAIGLFGWAPRVRTWFDDPAYIVWIGLSLTPTTQERF